MGYKQLRRSSACFCMCPAGRVRLFALAADFPGSMVNSNF